MDINLNFLKYFCMVVKEQNITRAAEKLYITQPALTKAIKELENKLDCTLLKRTQKGVLPTEEGIILYNHAENIFKEFNNTCHIIESKKNKNDLYIGTTTSNFFNIITDMLKILKKEKKDIKTHIIFNNINTLDELRKIGKLDIVIKSKNESIKDYKKIDDLELENIFIASKKHYKNLENKTIKLNELLDNYPLIIMDNTSPGRIHFNNYLKELGINCKPTYEFNSYDLCNKIIASGIGIGIDNLNNYDEEKFFIIKTKKIPKRYFDIGYIESSQNKYINDFIKLYNEEIKKKYRFLNTKSF